MAPHRVPCWRPYSLLTLAVNQANTTPDQMKTRIPQVDIVHLTILKSNPPKLLIAAHGSTSTAGWTDIELKPMRSESAGAAFFEFVGQRPDGPAVDVMTPVFAANIISPIPLGLERLVVVAEKNRVEVELTPPQRGLAADSVHIANERLRRVTGTSRNLNFDEAFMDALSKLPPDPHNGADILTTVQVVNITGQFGGIAGLQELNVEIETR